MNGANLYIIITGNFNLNFIPPGSGDVKAQTSNHMQMLCSYAETLQALTHECVYVLSSLASMQCKL